MHRWFSLFGVKLEFIPADRVNGDHRAGFDKINSWPCNLGYS